MPIRDYTSNTLIPNELLGSEIQLIPGCNINTTQRLTMASKNATQWTLVEGAEPPKMFTGSEARFKDYTWDKCPFNGEIIIKRIIPRFVNTGDTTAIKENNKLTVFYQSVETGKIGHFDIDSYRYLSPGFGYMKKKHNMNLLREETRIPKGTMFYSSAAHQGAMYAMGVNARVAYMSTIHTTEDAVAMSESFAAKLTYTSVKKYTFNLEDDLIPISQYGDEDNRKFFPDIGEYVNASGILIARRTLKFHGLINEYTDEELAKVKGNDLLIRADPGSKVIDVKVIVAPNRYEEIKHPDHLYHQLYKYAYQEQVYMKAFLEIYEEFKDYGFEDETSYLIHKYSLLMPKTKVESRNERCLSMDYRRLTRRIMDRKNPINFAYLEITLAKDHKAGEGSKSTNRHGNKGVASIILPDEWMPIDAYGFRADMIINSDSVVDRMNEAQLVELTLNRLSELVVMDSRHMSYEDAFDYIVSFLTDFNSNYGKLIYHKFVNRKADFVNACRNEPLGIMLNYPNTLENINTEFMVYICDKYNYRSSPVMFTYPINSKETRTVTTKDPVEIGYVYFYLLNKNPHPNAVELGYISHHQLPIKNPDAKDLSIQQTAIRFGEQELLVALSSLDPDIVSRFFNVCGNSPKFAQEIFYRTLKADNPLALHSLPFTNEEIARNNVPVKIARNIQAVSGCDMTKESFYEDLNKETL